MIRAAIFDLDGTLVDSLPGIQGALNRALAALGYPTHPAADVRRFIGRGAWWLARQALPTSAPDSAADELAAQFKADYAASWPQGTLPFPGITALLGGLAMPIGVLSNKPDPFTREIVARLFPTINFAAVAGEIPGIPPKPAPDGALTMAAALGAAPAEVLFVGDSQVDLQTATAAGMPAAIVSWGYDDSILHLPSCCRSLDALRAALP